MTIFNPFRESVKEGGNLIWKSDPDDQGKTILIEFEVPYLNIPIIGIFLRGVVHKVITWIVRANIWKV